MTIYQYYTPDGNPIHKVGVTPDYDLDAKLFPDKVIKVLDEREYKRHRRQYGYNDDLNKILRYQTEEIVKKMKAGEFPFIDEKVNEFFNTFLSKISKKV